MATPFHRLPGEMSEPATATAMPASTMLKNPDICPQAAGWLVANG
jgi:hypothetical protein